MAKRFRTTKKGIWILGVLLLFFGIFLGIAGRQINGSSQPPIMRSLTMRVIRSLEPMNSVVQRQRLVCPIMLREISVNGQVPMRIS